MQLEIYKPSMMEPMASPEWNREEVQAYIKAVAAGLSGVIFDEKGMGEAKKTLANIRKFKKAALSKCSEYRSYCLAPSEKFTREMKEDLAPLDIVEAEYDAQIKAAENFKKEEKQVEIKRLYEAMIGDLAALVPYERLHNPKWLNVTCSVSTITEELGGKIDRISAGLASIDTLGLDDDLAGRVKSRFLQDYDLAGALAEKDRIIREREELERLKAAQIAAQQPKTAAVEYTPAQQENPAPAQPVDDGATEELIDITFRIRVTDSQLRRLREFMRANGIRPERV